MLYSAKLLYLSLIFKTLYYDHSIWSISYDSTRTLINTYLQSLTGCYRSPNAHEDQFFPPLHHISLQILETVENQYKIPIKVFTRGSLKCPLKNVKDGTYPALFGPLSISKSNTCFSPKYPTFWSLKILKRPIFLIWFWKWENMAIQDFWT